MDFSSSPISQVADEPAATFVAGLHKFMPTILNMCLFTRRRLLRRIVCVGALAAALSLQAGHAALAGSASYTDGFNAWAHDFNASFAKAVVRPALDGVRSLPSPLPGALSNVFSNLTEPVSALSHAMVGDAWSATQSSLRFAVNSTLGLGGVLDVATSFGLPARKRHFSEGVCALGLPSTDQFLVVPGVGPSSVGVAGAAVVFMVGSTVALGVISVELAVASTLADLAGSAAALENAASAADGPLDLEAEEKMFHAYLKEIRCG